LSATATACAYAATILAAFAILAALRTTAARAAATARRARTLTVGAVTICSLEPSAAAVALTFGKGKQHMGRHHGPRQMAQMSSPTC
jgi:hypothetical protein